MTETDVLSNQTDFFDAEVLEQVPPSLPLEEDPLKEEKIQQHKKKTRILIVIGTVTVALVFMGVALLILVTPEQLPVLTVRPSPIMLKTTPQETQLKQKIDLLENNIRKADPIDIGFSYPPVTSDLYLDGQQH